MALAERWQLVNQDVALYAPEISRDTTPDEFLETEERHHTIIKFQNVLVGCKTFSDAAARDEWIGNHPMGKKVELFNSSNGMRKGGNIIEVRIGDPPDDLLAAIMIYLERELPVEHVYDWVI